MTYGEFYYPNGTAVPIEGKKYGMYWNRGPQFMIICPNRRILTSDTATITGEYSMRYRMNAGTRKISLSLSKDKTELSLLRSIRYSEPNHTTFI